MSSKLSLHFNLYSLIAVLYTLKLCILTPTKFPGSYHELCLIRGLSLLLVLPLPLVGFFPKYSDFPLFMKADIFKFQIWSGIQTQRFCRSQVCYMLPSAEHFTLIFSRIKLTRYFINHSQKRTKKKLSILCNIFISCLPLLWEEFRSLHLIDDARRVQKIRPVGKYKCSYLVQTFWCWVWKTNLLFRSKTCNSVIFGFLVFRGSFLYLAIFGI